MQVQVILYEFIRTTYIRGKSNLIFFSIFLTNSNQSFFKLSLKYYFVCYRDLRALIFFYTGPIKSVGKSLNDTDPSFEYRFMGPIRGKWIRLAGQDRPLKVIKSLLNIYQRNCTGNSESGQIAFRENRLIFPVRRISYVLRLNWQNTGRIYYLNLNRLVQFLALNPLVKIKFVWRLIAYEGCKEKYSKN